MISEQKISESDGDILELSNKLAEIIEAIQECEDRWLELSELLNNLKIHTCYSNKTRKYI